MNVQRCLASTARLHHVSYRCFYNRDLSRVLSHLAPRRFLATHRETPASSLLSSSLDRAASREGLNHNARLDSLGPFPLGIGPNPAYQTKQKPWRQLSAKGKVARTTARTTNLTVILFGGAFTCVLAYALATELFAKNSPTKLYEDACQKITASPEVARHLQPPLRFHINAPSPNAPRHRNRHVSSQLAHDQSGREHLLLHFYIESIPAESPKSFTPTPLTDITFQSAYEWSLQIMHDVANSSKKAFAYVVGIQLPADLSPRPREQSSSPHPAGQSQAGSKESSSAWSFAGVFSSIRGSNARPERSEVNQVQSVGWTEGEVHAELVKDDNGDFKYRYLLVDIPHSRTRKPLRIFVEKGQGFREGEGVFMWGS